MTRIAKTTASKATWEEVALDRQNHREETLSRSLDPQVDEVELKEYSTITSSPPERLLAKLSIGALKSITVTRAFLRKAVQSQEATNCITELLPERAISRAIFLDNFLTEHGKPIGPLHGLPISVKEHIGMKGLDLNAGFISWVGRRATADAHILEILWRAGAVFYARTTQPQTLMHLETSSNIYGVTTNPFNSTLTAGGSSGGEGALVGSRGSCLGIGTDIGGSIRSPAANNGVYGIKPTARRLPTDGWSATMLGSEHILPTIGPLSTSLEGCKIFMKTLIDAQPWHKEPSLYPFLWKEENFFKDRKVRVAVMWDDEVVKPHPPITRALKAVVNKLQESPHIEISQWAPWKHAEAWDIISSLYFADGGAEETAAIDASGEPWLPLSKHILLDNPNAKKHDIPSLWTATTRREEYRTAYANLLRSTAQSTGPNGEPTDMIDVILCPAGPGVAPKLNSAKWWGYTSQWNLLDYPAVVFPVDVVGKQKVTAEENLQEEKDLKEHKSRNVRDTENWELWREHGDAGYEGAPISLQLVGKRFEDEKMIQALEIIQKEAGLPFAIAVGDS